jgi:hypothetical protein
MVDVSMLPEPMRYFLSQGFSFVAPFPAVFDQVFHRLALLSVAPPAAIFCCAVYSLQVGCDHCMLNLQLEVPGCKSLC